MNEYQISEENLDPDTPFCYEILDDGSKVKRNFYKKVQSKSNNYY